MSLNIKAYVMLGLASIFWAGNFIIGKFAFVENISPFSLVFFRWLTVWFILLPFTYKEILSKKKEISNNMPLLLFLGLTSVGLFNSFVYVSLQYTQVINASLFNTAIPAAIILSCFIFKIEKTNFYQLLGLLISVLGILVIITNDATLLALGDFTKIETLLAAIGFLIISALSIRKIPGAIIIGILIITLISIFADLIQFKGVISTPPDIAPTFMKLDILGALNLGMLTVIMSFLFVNLFDTTGTLVGVATRANLLDEKYQRPEGYGQNGRLIRFKLDKLF